MKNRKIEGDFYLKNKKWKVFFWGIFVGVVLMMISTQIIKDKPVIQQEDILQKVYAQEIQTNEIKQWEKTEIYTAGDIVTYEGKVYKAKWWTTGEIPQQVPYGVWELLKEETKQEAPIIKQQENEIQTPSQNMQTQSDFKVIAYYPSWKPNEIEKIQFDVVTHVIYAFAIPTKEASLKPLENSDMVKQLIAKAHENNRFVLLAIGGWSDNGAILEPVFKQATQTDEKIKKFGDEIIKMCHTYGFDGIDIDWEHPRKDDASTQQYEKLMLYLSEQLHKEGKILTSAVLGGVSADGNILYDAAAHSDKVLNAVDWIHVMAYDGGDGQRYSSYEFSVNCANYWKETRKLSPNKIVLGVPFYARPSWASYEEILKSNENAFQTDHIVYNGMDVYYNGKETIQNKTKFAKQFLGGIMIWEITQDTSNKEKSLVWAIKQEINRKVGE